MIPIFLHNDISENKSLFTRYICPKPPHYTAGQRERDALGVSLKKRRVVFAIKWILYYNDLIIK